MRGQTCRWTHHQELTRLMRAPRCTSPAALYTLHPCSPAGSSNTQQNKEMHQQWQGETMWLSTHKLKKKGNTFAKVISGGESQGHTSGILVKNTECKHNFGSWHKISTGHLQVFDLHFLQTSLLLHTRLSIVVFGDSMKNAITHPGDETVSHVYYQYHRQPDIYLTI